MQQYSDGAGWYQERRIPGQVEVHLRGSCQGEGEVQEGWAGGVQGGVGDGVFELVSTQDKEGAE